MRHTQTYSGQVNKIDVTLEADGLILCVMVGHITEDLVRESMAKTAKYAVAVHARNEVPQLLIDAHDVTGHTSGARSQAKALGQMDIEKIAVSGPSPAAEFCGAVYYPFRRYGKIRTRLQDKSECQRWLRAHTAADIHDSTRKLLYILASISIFLALLAIAGWLFNNEILRSGIPGFRALHPATAATILLLATSLFTLQRRGKGNPLHRILPLISAIWCMIFGSLTLLRFIFGFHIPEHIWILGGQFSADGATAMVSVRSGFILFFIGIMILAILTGQQKRWQRITFHAASVIVFLSAIGAIINYGFGFQELVNEPISLGAAISFLLINHALQTLSVQEKLFLNMWNRFNAFAPAIFVGLAMVLLTGVAWQQSKSDLERTRAVAAQQQLASKELEINTRIAGYINTLRGYRSFFEASSQVSPQDYHTYFNTSEITANYPGFTALTFVRSVPANQNQTLTKEMRAYTSPNFPNYKSFAIYPESTQPTLYSTTLIEPASPTTRYGFDLSTNTTRRTALERARDSGQLTLSDTIDLNASRPEDGLGKRFGFYMIMPVYDQDNLAIPAVDRKKHIYGFVNALFENSKLFTDIFKNNTSEDIKYVITNNATQKILHIQNDDQNQPANQLQLSKKLTIGDQTWQLDMYTAQNFGVTGLGAYVPTLVLTGGGIFSVLAIALMTTQARRRERAVQLAENMTEDLNNERNIAVATQQKDEAVLSSIGDGVFAVDITGKISVFNMAAEKISGFTAHEAIGKPYHEVLQFVQEKTGQRDDSFIIKALTGNLSSMAKNTQLIRKDSTKVSVADSAAPIRDAHGKLLGAIVVFRDVTKELVLERAKSEFVSLASHQLRTPLSAINWYSEMLLAGDMGKLTKDQRAQMQQIFDGNQRMIALVDSLLNVSRLEVGKLRNQPENTSLVQIADSLEQELATYIKDKKLTFNRNLTSKLPTVYADPSLLRMILQNLLSNAVKYTQAGGTVTLAMNPAETQEINHFKIAHDKKYIEIRVTDTGYGIPASEQPKIFQKMYRAENVQQLDVEGTGLGLYIVKEVVQMLGGAIWFESVEGKGTTFFALIPLKTIATK